MPFKAFFATVWTNPFASLFTHLIMNPEACFNYLMSFTRELTSLTHESTSHGGTSSDTLSLIAIWLPDSITALVWPNSCAMMSANRIAKSSPWRGLDRCTRLARPSTIWPFQFRCATAKATSWPSFLIELSLIRSPAEGGNVPNEMVIHMDQSLDPNFRELTRSFISSSHSSLRINRVRRENEFILGFPNVPCHFNHPAQKSCQVLSIQHIHHLWHPSLGRNRMPFTHIQLDIASKPHGSYPITVEKQLLYSTNWINFRIPTLSPNQIFLRCKAIATYSPPEVANFVRDF